MIGADQPDFCPELVIAVSSKQDGTMLNRAASTHSLDAVANRINFCRQVGVDYDQVVYQQIIYGDDQNYDKIARVTTPNTQGVKADVLFTDTPGVGLFLPVADCIAMVFYDVQQKKLALAHVGRHASYSKLATKVVEEFKLAGSAVGDILVWLSPSVGKNSYKMEWFDRQNDPDWRGFYKQKAGGFFLDMSGYNRTLLMKAGVPKNNIFISPIDTARDKNYFSHSSGDTTGRIAVLAMIRF